MTKILKIPNFYYVMRDEMKLLPIHKNPLNDKHSHMKRKWNLL